MSGGHYEYMSDKPRYLAESIEEDLVKYSVDGNHDGYFHQKEPDHVLEAMRVCSKELRRVSELAHALEWYMSADYGPEHVAEALTKYRGMLSQSEIIAIAKATKTAEPGTAGYVLPMSFALEVINAYTNRP